MKIHVVFIENCKKYFFQNICFYHAIFKNKQIYCIQYNLKILQ